MKRIDLLSAIDELKDSDNIESAIDNMKDVAIAFCDNYETEFNNIRDELEVLAPHINDVDSAYQIAVKCSGDLY